MQFRFWLGFVLFFFSHPVKAVILYSEVYYKHVCNLKSHGNEAKVGQYCNFVITNSSSPESTGRAERGCNEIRAADWTVDRSSSNSCLGVLKRVSIRKEIFLIQL